MCKLIVADGPEGAGKDTVTSGLQAIWTARGVPFVYDFEPGGTPIGMEIRKLVKFSEHEIPPVTELFLFLAARAAFIEKRVKPALAEGKVFLTNRFSLSTMAYQLAGRGLPEEYLAAIKVAESGVVPYYVTLLVTPEIGLARKKAQGDDQDRFAKAAGEFHYRVRDGYRKYSEAQGAFIVDTDHIGPEEVLRQVSEHLDRKFPELLRA